MEDKKVKSYFYTLLVVIGAVGLIVLGQSGCEKFPLAQKYSVSEFKEKFERETNNALSSSSHPLRRRVENAHGTVDVRQAYVSSLAVETKDGSDDVGKDGKNIRRIKMTITTIWDGFIHKGGRTELTLLIENTGNGLKTVDSRISYTNAMINTEDSEFWSDLGGAVVTLAILCL
jgi:hypothetical protein